MHYRIDPIPTGCEASYAGYRFNIVRVMEKDSGTVEKDVCSCEELPEAENIVACLERAGFLPYTGSEATKKDKTDSSLKPMVTHLRKL